MENIVQYIEANKQEGAYVEISDDTVSVGFKCRAGEKYPFFREVDLIFLTEVFKACFNDNSVAKVVLKTQGGHTSMGPFVSKDPDEMLEAWPNGFFDIYQEGQEKAAVPIEVFRNLHKTILQASRTASPTYLTSIIKGRAYMGGLFPFLLADKVLVSEDALLRIHSKKYDNADPPILAENYGILLAHSILFNTQFYMDREWENDEALNFLLPYFWKTTGSIDSVSFEEMIKYIGCHLGGEAQESLNRKFIFLHK